MLINYWLLSCDPPDIKVLGASACEAWIKPRVWSTVYHCLIGVMFELFFSYVFVYRMLSTENDSDSTAYSYDTRLATAYMYTQMQCLKHMNTYLPSKLTFSASYTIIVIFILHTQMCFVSNLHEMSANNIPIRLIFVQFQLFIKYVYTMEKNYANLRFLSTGVSSRISLNISRLRSAPFSLSTQSSCLLLYWSILQVQRMLLPM